MDEKSGKYNEKENPKGPFLKRYLEIEQKNNESWENGDEEKIILFADIMGFKDAVRTHEHKRLYEQVNGFINEVHNAMYLFPEHQSIRYSIFSDSIVIASKLGDKRIAFMDIIIAATLLMLVSMEYNITISGCIAKGKLTFSEKEKQMIFGQALIDAYLQQNDMFYYGISIHKSLEGIVKELDFNGPKVLFYVPTMFKTGISRQYVLAWYDMPELDKVQGNFREGNLKRRYTSILSKLEKDANPRVRAYIYNTLQILDRIEEEKKNNK